MTLPLSIAALLPGFLHISTGTLISYSLSLHLSLLNFSLLVCLIRKARGTAAISAM